MMRRIHALLFILVALSHALPALAATDPRDFRIRNIYIGMSESELQAKAGEMDRVTRTDLQELDGNDKLELWQLKKDRDVVVGLDKQTRKVMIVLGNELTREDRAVINAGEYQYRVQLSLMPMQHDAHWVYHNDKFDIAFLFVMEATKTTPIIYKVIITDPSLRVKGGWLGGVEPRPGPKNDGPTWR